MNIYRTEKIYTSVILQDRFSQLEDHYVIVDNKAFNSKYSNEDYLSLANGVNFSKNKNSSFHQWMIYREGFSHQLVQTLLDMSSCSADEIVLDPFCGSGTTNIVASQLGFSTVGIDVNPMSVLLTDAKLSNYTSDDINKARELFKSFREFNGQIQNYDELSSYFTKKNLEGLVFIKSYLDTIENNKSKKILMAAYISIILDCSDRKRDGNGLKKKASKVENVYDYYELKFEQIINDIQLCSGKHTDVYSLVGSATNLNQIIKDNHILKDIGVIIFSPPYPNSFDYFESYKLELVLGGFVPNIKEIKKLRLNAIRSFVGTKNDEDSTELVNKLSEEIQRRIPLKEERTGRIDSRTRKVPTMLKAYFNDMFQVLNECYDILKKHKQVYIVVGQSAYLGVIIPTDLLLASYAETIGFHVKEIINCRKARTSTQQLNQYPYLKYGLRESVVILEK